MNMDDLKFVWEKEEIKTHSNVKIVGSYFRANSDKGVLFFPGISEHRGSFHHYADELAKQGINAWTFDINGQGDSTGNWDLKQMIHSFDKIQKEIKKKYKIKKLGVFGSSMGAMAVGILAAKKDSSIDCLVLSGVRGGLQDYFPMKVMNVAKKLPQKVIRYATILFDIVCTAGFKNYRRKTHKQYKIEKGYEPFARFGATKVPNLKKMIEGIEKAPRLDKYAKNIKQPILFVYGGKDIVCGTKKNKLPKIIQDMYDSVKSEKDLLIVKDADHGINTKTTPDCCYNEAPKYGYVKKRIIDHFKGNLG